MKKICKAISIVCSLCILFGATSVTAAAATPSLNEQTIVMNETQMCTVEEAIAKINFAEELRDAENGLIDKNVSDMVLQGIDLSGSVDEDISYSVKNLGKVVESGEEKGTLYSLTAVSGTLKNTGNTHDEDNVHCYATVIWMDNFGLKNELISVQGGWITERTLYDRTVYYGVDNNTVTTNPTSNKFSYDNLGMIGAQIHVATTVRSKGYNPVIMLTLSPTFLD